MAPTACIAAFSFALHLFFNNRYGYFRDEFDYIICGRHLAWGYVDQPPLLPVLSRIFLAIFGESLRSVRLLPALTSSALILLTGMITRELGGKRFAVVLSALTILIAPIYLSGGGLLTSNCDLEVLLWMGCAYFAIQAAKRDQPRYWFWFGVVAGIGLQEKYSIAVFGFAIVIGLLLTGQRRFLLNKWMWLGGAAALLIFLPNLLWNVAYHWPFVELMHNIKASGRDVALSPWEYFSQQALLILPSSALFWITGVIALPSGSTISGLPFSRNRLPRQLHRFRCPQRQKLLSCPHLSRLSRGRMHRDRRCHRSHSSGMAEARDFHAVARWRRSVRAAGSSHSPHRIVPPLHESAADQSAAQ
jgi:4-amino-4-deoxy-L-arabinose transferase-like glycosyltransferase